MAEIIKPDCFNSWQSSENEMTRQFIEQSIRTLGYRLQKALERNDQYAIEKIFDMRTKALRLLKSMLNDQVSAR